MDTILEDMTVGVVPTVAEPYAARRRIMDADSHVMEPPGWLEEHADARTRELLRPVQFPDSIQDDIIKALDGAARRASDPVAFAEAEQAILSAKRWFALGAWEPTERSRAMDILGFESQLVFPTHGKSQFLGEDLELLVGGHRALNRGVNAFCAEDRRLVPVASVPWLDEETTMSILLEALDGGAGAAMVQAIPGEVSPTHPQYAGVWATLEERGVPFVLHISGRVRPMNPAFFYNGRDVENPWGNNVRGKEYMASHHPPEDFLSALVLDGVFEAHPRLMGGCIELSGVWVVSWMRRLDHCQEMWGRGDDTLTRLPMKPSEYVQRNLFFTPFAGEPVGWMIEQCGESMFMFSSDYPHWEGTPDPIGTFEATMDDTTHSAREAFYSGNYATLFGYTDAGL